MGVGRAGPTQPSGHHPAAAYTMRRVLGGKKEQQEVSEVAGKEILSVAESLQGRIKGFVSPVPGSDGCGWFFLGPSVAGPAALSVPAACGWALSYSCALGQAP